MSDLPTITFETAAGEMRRIRYERSEGAPHRAVRHVDRWDDSEGWVLAGSEALAELVINGEHRAAVTVTEGP